MKYVNIVILLLLIIGAYLLYVAVEKKEYQKQQVQVQNKTNEETKPPSFIKKIKKYMKKFVPSKNDSSDIVSAVNGKRYPYKIDYAVDPEDMYDPITTNQYHPDYVEVLSVLNKLIKPSIFNPATLPVSVIANGEKKDVFPLATRFVFDLSRRSSVSLKLVDIIYIKKYITEDQEKISFDLVIQKESPIPSKVKMLLRCVIIYNTNNVVDGNNFFDEAWSTKLTKKPILDSAFVLGYSTGYFDIESQAQTEYYAFKDVDDTKFMDESTVNSVVSAVRRKHALENGCLNVSWDEDGRDYWVSDLDASSWGNTNRRNTDFSKYPKPCSSDQSNELYGAFGTKVFDI